MQSVEDLISRYCDSSDNSLYAIIGADQAHVLVMNREIERSDKVKLGKLWFEGQKESIKKAICGNRVLQERLASKSSDDSITAALILSEFLVDQFKGIQVAILVLLITRIGVNSFCS